MSEAGSKATSSGGWLIAHSAHCPRSSSNFTLNLLRARDWEALSVVESEDVTDRRSWKASRGNLASTAILPIGLGRVRRTSGLTRDPSGWGSVAAIKVRSAGTNGRGLVENRAERPTALARKLTLERVC